MRVYIDLLILLNSLFNYVLLNSVNFILKRNIGIGRIVITSVIGNITILLLEVDNQVVFILGKFVMALLLNVICFGYKDVRYLIKNVIYFYLVSMLMGGVMYFFGSSFVLSDYGLVSKGNGIVKYIVVVFISVCLLYFYLFRFKDLKNNYSC